MNDCIFCKIVAGKLPKHLIFEDEHYLAFLDIYPRAKGHTLLIPKSHYRWTYDVPRFGDYWEIALKITKAIQKTMNPSFVTYVTHGLAVSHAHIHILPRFHETEFVPDVKTFEKNEFEKIAEGIRKGF